MHAQSNPASEASLPRALFVALLTASLVLAGLMLQPAHGHEQYRDAPPDHPFFEEISWLTDQGIAEGFDDGSFRPGRAVTRQAMVAFLHRAEGSPRGPFPDPGFHDVDEDHPFFTEIAWAADAGVTEGFPDGTFQPGSAMGRQATAAFLHRLAGEPRPQGGGKWTSDYPDVPEAHDFYTEISWMSATDITEGYPDDEFKPGRSTARQAMAAFTRRYVRRADDGSSDDGATDGGSDDGSTGDGPTDDGSNDGTTDDGSNDSGSDDTSDDGPTAGRQALLERREGFGRQAGSGSADWQEVTVSSLAGSGDGSLRDALSSGQRWITFEEGLTGTIDLGSTLSVPSNVVIDGRGADVTVRGDSGTTLFSVRGTDNIIMTNLKLQGGYDGIQVYGGSNDIWLDHLTARDAADEIIGITGDGSRPDQVTVSWSWFETDGKVMLLADNEHDPSGAADRVTLHHNVYHETFDRHPLMRFARVHAYNNWTYHWGREGTGQGVRVGNDGEFLSERNIYDNAYDRPAIIPENLGTYGYVDSVADLTTGDPRLEERQPSEVFDPDRFYSYEADEPGQGLRDTLTENAGWQPAG